MISMADTMPELVLVAETELKRLDEHREQLKEAGLGDAEIKRVVDPLESFHLQLKQRLRPTSTSKRFRGNVLDWFSIYNINY